MFPLLATLCSALTFASPSPTVSASWPLGGEGGWDLLTVDPQSGRLFVPRATHVVVCDRDGRAAYFSRSPIPYPRDLGGEVDDRWVAANPCYKHLGLYAYKAALLDEFASLPVGKLEEIERLEQLRVIENGRSIAVGFTDDPSIGVDTPEDAARFEARLDGAAG